MEENQEFMLKVQVPMRPRREYITKCGKLFQMSTIKSENPSLKRTRKLRHLNFLCKKTKFKVCLVLLGYVGITWKYDKLSMDEPGPRRLANCVILYEYNSMEGEKNFSTNKETFPLSLFLLTLINATYFYFYLTQGGGAIIPPPEIVYGGLDSKILGP